VLIGPVFTREVAIAPRRVKLYVGRTAYGLALLLLMATAWLVLTGTQLVRDVGDLARFGGVVFQILAPCNWPWPPSFPRCWQPAKSPTKKTAARWSSCC